MKKIISTNNAPAAIGPYSQGVQVGNLLYTSGQVPIDPATGNLHGSDVREQTRQVLANVKAVVEAGGGKVSQIVKTLVFMTDLKQFSVLNEEYAAFFKEHGVEAAFPARSCVEVSALPRGALVEIEAIVQLS
jgi:2-iminobutanoate/2-iminopropanoate deaminase